MLSIIELQTKKCATCGCDKSLFDYYAQRGGRFGKQASCKPCSLDTNKHWHKANRDRVRERQRRHYHDGYKLDRKEQKRAAHYRDTSVRKRRRAESRLRHPHAQRAFDLKRNYGLTIEQYDALLASQGGLCAICKATPGNKRLAVDHNHETGVVRGLLCDRCNPMIGYAKESIARLEAAIAYLKKTENRSS